MPERREEDPTAPLEFRETMDPDSRQITREGNSVGILLFHYGQNKVALSAEGEGFLYISEEDVRAIAEQFRSRRERAEALTRLSLQPLASVEERPDPYGN